MNHKPFCNTEILFNSLKDMEQKFLSLNEKNILLIITESSVNRYNLSTFIDALYEKSKKNNGKLIWIQKVNANPSQKDIIDALNQIGETNIELIIAIGGGSVIDLAKGISVFHNILLNDKYSIEDITESLNSKKYLKNDQTINIIAVPTTSGTGSEVTQWATIWDVDKTIKYSIDSPSLKPKMAVIIPELTLSVPPKMTLSTGLDAMCQAVEAYWSKHTNPIVQEIAYRAIELVLQNLRKSIDNPQDITSREKLSKASILAGLAFSQTRTTACHSISYPLTMYFDIPHGLAASITLAEVGKINKGHFSNDIQLFELFDRFSGLQNWIDNVSDGIVNMRLTWFGLKIDDIPLIVDNAFTGGRMDNNPVDLSRKDVENILHSIL